MLLYLCYVLLIERTLIALNSFRAGRKELTDTFFKGLVKHAPQLKEVFKPALPYATAAVTGRKLPRELLAIKTTKVSNTGRSTTDL